MRGMWQPGKSWKGSGSCKKREANGGGQRSPAEENRYNERDRNLGTRRGKSLVKERDEGGKLTLPKEGARRRGVGGGLTTKTEKSVQREETERVKR